MPVDRFSGQFAVKTRDRVRDDYLRDYRFRIPGALTDEGTQPFVDASNFADGCAPLYYDAKLCADATGSSTSTGTALDEDGEAIDCPRQPEGSASGWIVVAASTGGGQILEGTLLKYPPSNLVYRTLVTGFYHDGDLVAVESVATGPTVNLDANVELRFVNPPIGFSATATVFQNTDGSGLTGGVDAENDDDYRRRQAERRRNPPAAGNETAVIKAVEDLRGIAIQKAFVYPAILGPATMGVAFTMRPAQPGASRLPNGVQVGLVEAALKAVFPGDDGIMVASGLDDGVVIALKVTWRATALGWLDLNPWPPYYPDPVHVVSVNGPGAVDVASAWPIAPPSVGKTIGFYDPVRRAFARKRIAAVATATPGHYTITFDLTTMGASDPAFVPAVGALVSPWSDSLNDVVAPVLRYLDRQGPGEMVATFADPGRRQRRVPEPDPETYPSRIENRLVDELFRVAADAQVALPAALPKFTKTGTAGLLFYLHKLQDLAVAPQ